MKKWSLVILVITMLLAMMPVSTLAANLPDVPGNEAVLDQSGVLSSATVQHLVNGNNDLFGLTGGEVMFLITDFLPMGQTIEDYTLEVFNHWQVGSAQNNNGVLVVMSMVEGEYWITVGGGLTQHMSRSYLAGVVADYFSPYFSDGNYDMAVRNLFDVLSLRIYELFAPAGQQAAAGAATQGAASNNLAHQVQGVGFSASDLILFIVFVIVALIVIRALLFPRRRHWGGGMMGGPMMGPRWGWGWGRRRWGMGGGFLGGYMMGRARHRRPQQRHTFNRPGGNAGGNAGGGFTRGGSSRGGGAGGSIGSRPTAGPRIGGSRPSGGLGGFGGGGRSSGGFTRGGMSRGGGFGGRRR